MRRYILVGILGGVAAVLGCGNDTPTSTSPDLVPLSPETVEIRLPFDAFGAEARVFRGFGAPVELGHALVARDFNGALTARTLARFGGFPVSVDVADTTGAVVSDSSLTFVGGRVVAHLDTAKFDADSIESRFGLPTFTASTLGAPWHPPTVTWELSADTVGGQSAWPEPGAGPATRVASEEWRPTITDSLVFEVDSATVAAWTDTTDHSRGVRIDAEAPGLEVRFRDVSLLVEARPSVNPDTLVFVETGSRQFTFVYDPSPAAPPNGLRFGGTPAWRTTLRLSLPETLDGPPEACATLGCPYSLTSEELSFASVLLETREAPAALQLADTLRLDIRPVLRPDLLPKSPLGSSLFGGLLRALPAEDFAAGAGTTVELPLTSFVRNLIRGETAAGDEAHSTLAILAADEPASVGVGDFEGPGSASPPVLRLVVTVSEGVNLP